MNERVLELIYKIEGVDKSIRDINRLTRSQEKVTKGTRSASSGFRAQASAMDQLGGQFKKNIDFSNRMRVTTGGLRRTIGAIRNEILVFVFALGGLVTALKSSVDASSKTRNALVGLEAIAQKTTGNMDAARDAAIALTNDGILSVMDSTTALKNLLATGFSLPQAINLIEGFKDSASFARQATFGWGESIVRTTEGIRLGLSNVADAAGMTKNLSQILVQMGKSQQDVMNVQSDASVRLALYTGMMKELALFTGNAKLALNEFSGTQAQLSTTIFRTKAAIGDVLIPSIGGYLQSITATVKNLGKLILRHKTLISLKIGEYFQGAATALSFFASAASTAFRIATLGLVNFNNSFTILTTLMLLFLSRRILTLLTNKLTSMGSKWAEATTKINTFNRTIEVVPRGMGKVQRSIGMTASGALSFMNRTVSDGTTKFVHYGSQIGRLKTAFTGFIAFLGGPVSAAILGISVLIAAGAFLWGKYGNAVEKTRKKMREDLATQIDRIEASVRQQQELKALIQTQISRIKQTIEEGKATDELTDKLSDYERQLKITMDAIEGYQLSSLIQQFDKATIGIEDFTKVAVESMEWVASASFLGAQRMLVTVMEDATGATADLFRELNQLDISKVVRDKDVDLLRDYQSKIVKVNSSLDTLNKEERKQSQVLSEVAKIIANMINLLDPFKKGLDDTADAANKISKEMENMAGKLDKAQQKLEDIIVRTTSTAEAFELFKFGRMIAEMGELVEVAEKLKVPQERIDEFLQVLNKAGVLGREEILNKFAEKREKAAKREREVFERENQKMVKAYQRDFDEIIDIQNEAGLRRAELEGKIGRDIIFENSQTLVRLQEIMEQRPELAKRISEIIKLIHKNEAEETKRIHEEQIQSQIDSIDQFVGGLFNLGETIANIFGGIRRDFKGDMDQLTRDFKRGVIDQAEFARRMAIIQKNISTEIANSWKDLGRTLLQSFSQVLQQMLIKIAAAKAASQGLEAGLTSLAGLGAIGIPVAAGLLAATLLAPNRPESFGAQTPEGDLGGEGGRRRFGGIAQAPTINLSLTPTVSIIGETIYISGGTIEELETGLEDLIVETTRKAIDTGELTFDPLFETGG